MKFVLVATLVAVAAAAKLPEEAVVPADDVPAAPVPDVAAAAPVVAEVVERGPPFVAILSDTREVPVDGSFSIDFQAENGIRFSELATAGVAGQSNYEGIYSYPDENGNLIEIRYVANENGFQAQGDHLPVAPAAPPHVAELLRIAEEQRAAGITFE
ncbi:cuticle protein AMP4-like [Oratosquilla oratoria]|uniref:cuticle protein AMP4-like n=1 Tax=Oratosquilla oratoria TaxID=337810 RepID=UPI003F761876